MLIRLNVRVGFGFKRICQDESDTIISGALCRLTVAAQNHKQRLLIGESNAEEQYQDHGVSIRYSDSFPLADLCTSASCEGSLSRHGSSRSVFDSGREG